MFFFELKNSFENQTRHLYEVLIKVDLIYKRLYTQAK